LLQASLPPQVELAVRDASAGAVVSGEAGQLQQVILNLCNNAAQAMGNVGRVDLEVDLRDVGKVRPLTQGSVAPGRRVGICVSAAGHGRDDALLERIFEPFFTTRSAGTGLGLATVREIVREHGGAIAVHSTPGVGTRFAIWLPCAADVVPAQGG